MLLRQGAQQEEEEEKNCILLRQGERKREAVVLEAVYIEAFIFVIDTGTNNTLSVLFFFSSIEARTIIARRI